jgi:hypothetical protein
MMPVMDAISLNLGDYSIVIIEVYMFYTLNHSKLVDMPLDFYVQSQRQCCMMMQSEALVALIRELCSYAIAALCTLANHISYTRV